MCRLILVISICLSLTACGGGGGSGMVGSSGHPDGIVVLSPASNQNQPLSPPVTITASEGGYNGGFTVNVGVYQCLDVTKQSANVFRVISNCPGGEEQAIQISDSLGNSAMAYIFESS